MGEAAGKGKERWPQVRLGDLITLLSGRDLTPDQYNDIDLGIPYITGATNIVDNSVLINRWTQNPVVISNLNDILLTCKGTVGEIAVNTIGPCHIARQFMAIRPDTKKIDKNYLKNLLTYNAPILVSKAKSMIPGITRDDVLSLKIPLPPLPEQRRIAAVLDQVSSLIALRKAQLAKLDLLVKARFVEMFGDPVKNEMGWEVGTIGSICSLIYRYPTFYDIEYVDNGVPVVQIRNLDQGGSIDYDKQKYVHITAETNDRYPQTQLQIKDILMAVRGDGSTAKRIGMVTDKALLYANISPNLLLLRTNQKCIPEYLYNYLTSNSGQKYLEKYITKTAKKTITARNIKSITIPIPPPDIQYEFKENIFKMNNLRKIQNRNLHSLNNIRSRLLQECFG